MGTKDGREEGSAKNLGFDAASYTALAGFDSDWRDTWWHQDTLELMARRLGFGEARRVLDVGCGAGHWGQRLSTLLPPDAEVVGVDHEPAFLEAARERAERFPHAFTYREGDALALPFEDDRFDLVTCQTVLIHVADAAAALREMARVTRPGGLVLAAEPNNLANALLFELGEPEAPFEAIVERLRFARACIAGKRALGQGDATVGERLLLLMQDLGLAAPEVYKNDRCARWLPPYDTPAERLQVAQLASTEGMEAGLFGDRATTERLYRAGGGDPARFDALWEGARARDREVRAAVEAGTYRTTGGFSMYLAAGRKPAAQPEDG